MVHYGNWYLIFIFLPCTLVRIRALSTMSCGVKRLMFSSLRVTIVESWNPLVKKTERQFYGLFFKYLKISDGSYSRGPQRKGRVHYNSSRALMVIICYDGFVCRPSLFRFKSLIPFQKGENFFCGWKKTVERWQSSNVRDATDNWIVLCCWPTVFEILFLPMSVAFVPGYMKIDGTCFEHPFSL